MTVHGPSSFDQAYFLTCAAIEWAIALTGPPSLRAIIKADRARRPAFALLAATWVLTGATQAAFPWLYTSDMFVGVGVGAMFAQAALYNLVPALWRRRGARSAFFQGPVPSGLVRNAALAAWALLVVALLGIGAVGLSMAPQFGPMLVRWLGWTLLATCILTGAGVAFIWACWSGQPLVDDASAPIGQPRAPHQLESLEAFMPQFSNVGRTASLKPVLLVRDYLEEPPAVLHPETGSTTAGVAPPRPGVHPV